MNPAGEPVAAPEPVALEPMRVPWGIVAGVGAFIGAEFFALVGASIFGVIDAVDARRATITFDLVVYQFLALGTAICAVWLLSSHKLVPSALGFSFPGWAAIAGAIAAIPVLILAADLIAVVWNVLFHGFQLRGNTNEIPVVHGVGTRVVVAFWAIVEAPLVEETLFRGILYQGVRQFLERWLPYNWAIFGGAVISGLIFGLAHGEPHTLPILAITGMGLAYIFQYTRSLVASAAAHGALNAIAIASIFAS